MVHTFVATMRSGWPRLIRLRRPLAGDHTDAFPRLLVVGETGERALAGSIPSNVLVFSRNILAGVIRQQSSRDEADDRA
jgi:hypothetical protein